VISTLAHSIVIQTGNYVSSELMVQTKHKLGTVVENSHPRTFVGGT